MAFFDNLKTSLKQKWLQFFQDNRHWIAMQMEVESVYTPDGGRRPPSYLILGVASALEPQLADLMLPFSKLNPDADALIEVLELNFDPDLLLGNRFDLQVVPEELGSNDIVIEALTEVALHELSDTSLDAMGDEVVLVQSDEEPIVVINVAEADELSDTLDEIAEAMGLEELDDKSYETPNVAQPNESGDVLSDVWGENTSSEPEQANQEPLKAADKQAEHDEEISRLFPNH